jgi:hypothetical protein
MNVYVLRLRDGGCVMVLAESDSDALIRSQSLVSPEEVASVRELGNFAARFSLSDEGQLSASLLDGLSIQELLEHEYPFLRAARSQSFAEFGPATNINRTSEFVLYTREDANDDDSWEHRDKRLTNYAVLKERDRFAN